MNGIRTFVPILGVLACSACAGLPDATADRNTPSNAVGEAREASTGCVTLAPTQNSGIANGAEASANMSASETSSVGLAGGQVHETLLQFDLSSIPANAGIVSATLGLDVWKASGASTVGAYFVTSPWAQSTVTWNTFGGAYSTPAAASFANGGPVATGGNVAIAGDVTSMVQSWVVSGGQANDGLLLQESDTQVTTFWTTRQPTGSLQPSLAVCYSGCAAGWADTGSGCDVNTIVSWYKAENDYLDAEGHNNGTEVGSVPFTAGEVGQAFYFPEPGSDANSVTATTNGFPTGNADRTVEGWVRADNPAGSYDQKFFGYGDTSAGGGGVFSVGIQNQTLLVDLFGYGLFDTTTVTPGEVLHFAATVSGGVLTLYKNGVQVNQATPSFSTTAGTTLTIGTSPPFAAYFGTAAMQGYVDELTFYNTALSASQVQAIYDLGSSGKP